MAMVLGKLRNVSVPLNFRLRLQVIHVSLRSGCFWPSASPLTWHEILGRLYARRPARYPRQGDLDVEIRSMIAALKGSASTVSLIVPTYRRNADVEKLLASVFAGTRLPNEVIIVDNDPD